jgi:hypothetical protein
MSAGQFRKYPIQQVAYYVPDARAAAKTHSANFGSGPYFVADHIPISLCRYRGKPGVFDHTSAYGQWGDVMIEFVQVHGKEPSVFSDLHPNGGPAFHHVALIVDNLQSTMREFEAAGYKEGMYAEVVPGAGFAMMDATHELGYFIELYEPTPPLLGVYHLVKNASYNFDGTNVCRNFSLT